MIPQSFQYESPQTLQEAIELLNKYGDEAKILSGGHSLIPMMKLRFASPEYVIDINGIPGLSHISEDNGVLKIGALTREADLEHSPLLAKHFPIFGDVTKLIADPQVRYRGTVGGNVANGSPIGDSPPALIALSATVTLRSASGTRTMPLEDYFIDYGKQDRQPGEFVESMFVPRPKAESHVAVYKITKRRDEDISALCGAFHLEQDASGVVTHIRIAFGGVRGRTELPSYVAKAQSGEIPLDTFITHNLPLDEINTAFDLMHEGKSIRTVIHF